MVVRAFDLLPLLLSIDRKTLERYVKKYKQSENKDNVSFVPNYNTGQVFSNELENLLVAYLITAAKLHYGLSQKTIRVFVFEFGKANNVKMPENWSVKKKHHMIGSVVSCTGIRHCHFVHHDQQVSAEQLLSTGSPLASFLPT